MILVPIYTPPLDTAIGTTRRCAQLVDINIPDFLEHDISNQRVYSCCGSVSAYPASFMAVPLRRICSWLPPAVQNILPEIRLRIEFVSWSLKQTHYLHVLPYTIRSCVWGGGAMRESDDYTVDLDDLIYDEEDGRPSERWQAGQECPEFPFLWLFF